MNDKEKIKILKESIEESFGHCSKEYAKGQIKRDEGYRIIFSHSFAKTFFKYKIGSTYIARVHGTLTTIYKNPQEDKNVWKYHIQKMALSENPFEYIKKYLKAITFMEKK